MTFDKLLKEAGEFGLFQKLFICGFVHTAMVVMGTSYWTQIYILLVPPHRCKISEDDNIFAQPALLNLSSVSSSQCHISITDGDMQSTNNSDSSACPYGWVYDYDSMYRTFSSQHNWVCDNSWRIYTIHTCYWLGDVVGFFLFGSLSDRFGRKRSFMGCVIVMFVGDFAAFFTATFPTFLIARFISAIGEANLATCCFVLAIEYVGPKYRIISLAVWSFSYTFTASIMPFIVYAVGDWHYILAYAWAVSLVSLIVTSSVPESASWLMTRGRTEDAAKSIYRVAKVNGKSLTLNYIKEVLIQEKSKMDSQTKVSLNNETKTEKDFQPMSFSQAIIGLFRTPNMRKNTILLTILWMICSSCYVGNSLETTNLPFTFRISYAVGGIAELPANIICLLTLDKIGRRWANVIFFFFGGTLGIIAGGGYVKNPIVVIALASIMRMCNASSYDIVFTMSSELYPTVVRGRGVSLTRIFGGLAAMLSPFIFSLAESKMGKLFPLEVFGLLFVVGGMLTLFLPETAGEHIPHTLEEGENFGKTQSFFYCPFLRREKTASQRSNSSLEYPVAPCNVHGFSGSFTRKVDDTPPSDPENTNHC